MLIGANYHPHDWDRKRWPVDINLMRDAGFNAIRVGHLCWDSFEPEDGTYTFEWFDEIMELLYEAGFKVFLDISIHPAPIWVHQKCPGVNITSRSGTEQASLHRYMEDMADPEYQHYAFRFAEIFIERYKNHPALYAFSMCNEIGSGRMSFSEYSRKRFIDWLEKRYGTIDELNKAWSTQRWCRRLLSFDDVVFPENEISVAMPEARLDMRRFFSDGLVDFLQKFSRIIKNLAPEIPYTTNLYPGAKEIGYDYLNSADTFMDYPGMGYYPDFDMDGDMQKYFLTIIKEDLNELGKPLWFLEFQTGKEGIWSGPKGYTYMQLMLGLLNRGEVFLAWTWRTMYSGEEQFYYGLLGHDGLPSPNYEEFKRAAADLKKLEHYSFPYMPKPEVALAFDYDSWWFSQFHPRQFKTGYTYLIMNAHEALTAANVEYNMVSIKKMKNTYKLVVIPNHIVIDAETAEAVREYVKTGGCVVMTATSGMVDGNGHAHTSLHPGLLADVFGIRIAGFYRTDMPWSFSQETAKHSNQGKEREMVEISIDGNKVVTDIDYYEVLELNGAKEVAKFVGKDMTAVSVNKYGTGCAYYVATETDKNVLSKTLDFIMKDLGIERELELPEGVQGRKISEGQYFLVNTMNHDISVKLPVKGKCVLDEQDFTGEMVLRAYCSELIITTSNNEGDEVK